MSHSALGNLGVGSISGYP